VKSAEEVQLKYIDNLIIHRTLINANITFTHPIAADSKSVTSPVVCDWIKPHRFSRGILVLEAITASRTHTYSQTRNYCTRCDAINALSTFDQTRDDILRRAAERAEIQKASRHDTTARQRLRTVDENPRLIHGRRAN